MSLIALLCLAGCSRPADTGVHGGEPSAAPSRPTSAPAFNGGSVGNGGDDTPIDEGSAWFLGNEPVSYCIQVAPDFGVPNDEAATHVASAIEAWRKYVDLKGVNDSPGESEPDSSAPPPIATRFEYVPSCDGSQRLTFYLGGMPDEVVRYRSRYNRPLAFAQRLSYDIASERGRGFVWIQSHGQHAPGFPDWRIRQTLQAMLLHEVGHVFGCAHVTGTIMAARIVADIRRNMVPSRETPLDWETFTIIDRRRILLMPRAQLHFTNLPIFEPTPGVFLSVGYPLASMTATVGKHPSVKIQIHQGAPPAERTAPGLPNASRSLLDFREVGRQRGDAPIFRRTFLRPGSSEPETHALATESITFASVQRRAWETSIIAELNGDSFKIRLWRIGDRGPTLIFQR